MGTFPAVVPTTTLSEAASKEYLAPFGVPIAPERLVADADAAAAAAAEFGLPVVAKLCGDNIAHKTERGLVRLHLGTDDAVREATDALLAAATPADGEVAVLIAPMIAGARELIAGVANDPQFGPTVMLGVGGILAEVVADVSIRLAPIARHDAAEMIADLSMQALLGEFRGEPAVDRTALENVLLALSEAAIADPDLWSIDLNPLIISGGRPVAVDALVERVAAHDREVN